MSTDSDDIDNPGPGKSFARSYPHMCRDDHIEIGHADSGDDERCPLCRLIAALQPFADVLMDDGKEQMPTVGDYRNAKAAILSVTGAVRGPGSAS